MQRILCVIAMLLCLGSAYGALSQCDDRCPDELAGHKCPPMCPTCHCVTHSDQASPTKTPTVAALDTSSLQVDFELAETVVPSPDPKELLRVPRFWA